MSQEKIETKQRILNAAKKLFSDKGFSATSIREIAETAKANVSAVSYHFESKQGLYWALLEEAFDWLEGGVRKVAETSASPEEMTLGIFDFFNTDPTYLRSTMKSLLTENLDMNSDATAERTAKKFSTTPGVPGYSYFVNFLKKHLPDDIPEEAVFWIVNSIFTSTVHLALMSTTSKFRMMESTLKSCSGEFCKLHLSHLCAASIEYGQKHAKELADSIQIPAFQPALENA